MRSNYWRLNAIATSASEIVDFDSVGFDQTQIRIHRLDDIADPFSGLIGVNDPPVVVTLAMDEREEVVVEGEQDPVVFDGERQLLLVRCTEKVVIPM